MPGSGKERVWQWQSREMRGSWGSAVLRINIINNGSQSHFDMEPSIQTAMRILQCCHYLRKTLGTPSLLRQDMIITPLHSSSDRLAPMRPRRLMAALPRSTGR